MRKFTMWLAAAMAVLSLAACTPTQVAETAPETTASSQGLAPGEDRNPPEGAVSYEAAVSVLVYGIEGDGIKSTMDSIAKEELEAQDVVDKLIEYGVLDDDTEVVSFSVEGDGIQVGPGVESAADGKAAAEKIGTLDLSKAPATDELTIAAIANTFIDNFELDKLQILAEGSPVDGDVYYEYNSKLIVKKAKSSTKEAAKEETTAAETTVAETTVAETAKAQ